MTFPVPPDNGRDYLHSGVGEITDGRRECLPDDIREFVVKLREGKRWGPTKQVGVDTRLKKKRRMDSRDLKVSIMNVIIIWLEMVANGLGSKFAYYHRRAVELD